MRILHLVVRRPFVRGIGPVSYVALASALATGLAWGAATIDDALTALKVGTTAAVLKDHVDATGRPVRLAGLPREFELLAHPGAHTFTLCSRERARPCTTPFQQAVASR